jgi:predicted metal-binding protein
MNAIMSHLDQEVYAFTECKQFDIGMINFDPLVIKYCEQNACGHFGKNHMCPPAVKDMEAWREEITSFPNAVMITKVYPTSSSYDMKAWLEAIADFQKRLVTLKENLTSDFPHRKYLVLGAGACSLCKACTYPDGDPCRFPDKALSSVEACGIDVMRLSKNAGVKYNNGKNTVTYLGVVLFQ